MTINHSNFLFTRVIKIYHILFVIVYNYHHKSANGFSVQRFAFRVQRFVFKVQGFAEKIKDKS